MNVVLFGAPGSGKGTQSMMMASELGMKHISTGDILRAAIREKSALGIKAQEYMNRGDLVPDDVVIAMVEEVLKGINDKSFILDGFPRTSAQAVALEKVLSDLSLKIDFAIFLDVPREKLMRRITGRRIAKGSGEVYHVEFKPPKTAGVCDVDGSPLEQRSDDREEVVDQRLRAYEESTEPLIEYYKKQGIYTEVDGDRGSDEVFADIKKML